MRLLLTTARGKSPASHRDRRGARLTRREEGEYREYSTDEQRSQPGCIVGRMQRDFCHVLLVPILLAAMPVLAEGPVPVPAEGPLEPYEPSRQVDGTIGIWGHGAYGKRLAFVEGLVGHWEEAFRKHQPGIEFDNRLHGTASAIGALYTGVGDLALLGREIWPPEVEAFSEVFGYPPTGIEVMTGSFNVRNRGYAIVVFVHKDNPIKGLTLAQLDAIFSADRLRGYPPVDNWADLGVGGDWADQPVRLYGLPIARGFAVYLEDRVFLGGRKWNPSLREYPDDPNSVSIDTDGANRQLADLAQDPYGIGYAGLVYHHPGVKAVALAETPQMPAVHASEETVRDRSYPLTRVITAYVNKPPEQEMDAKTTEFVRFILSSEGQAIVEESGAGYLSLLPEFARRELNKLEEFRPEE